MPLQISIDAEFAGSCFPLILLDAVYIARLRAKVLVCKQNPSDFILSARTHKFIYLTSAIAEPLVCISLYCHDPRQHNANQTLTR